MTTADVGMFSFETGARFVYRVVGGKTPTGGMKGCMSERGCQLCAWITKRSKSRSHRGL